MNEVKRTRLLDRLRAAGRVLMGKPTRSITFGVEVKRCSDCERSDRGDRKSCEICGYKIHSMAISDLPDCNDCARTDCQYEPHIGEWTRPNCPLHIRKEA